VKIETRNVGSTLKNISNGDFKALLLYGAANSSIGLRFRETMGIFQKHKYEVSNLVPEDLKGEGGALAEKFVATSIFSANILFVLKLMEKGNMFTKHLENLFETVDLMDNKNFLLILADSLESSSSLRKYAEKSRYIACIACYEENSVDLANFARKKLGEYNLAANSEVINYIVSISSSSTAMENEIQKLYLYKNEENRNVSMEDVQNCLVDNASANLEDFIKSFCSLDRQDTLRAMDKIFCDGLEPIVILRSMIRHFLMLQRIYSMLLEGKKLEEIFEIERIFWKSKISLGHYVNKWTMESTGLLLEKMIAVEKNIKFGPSGAQLEIENFVLRCFL
jgi:DNA polymerase-3 subunit delta